MSIRNIEKLFHPGSVAVIGASDREHSLGALVMRNLREGGFARAHLARQPEAFEGQRPCRLARRGCLAGGARPGRRVHTRADRAPHRGAARRQGHAGGNRAERRAARRDEPVRHHAPAGDARCGAAPPAARARPQLRRLAGARDEAQRELRACERLAGKVGLRLAVRCTDDRDAGLGQRARRSVSRTSSRSAMLPMWTSPTCSTISAAMRARGRSCCTWNRSAGRASSCRPRELPRATSR